MSNVDIKTGSWPFWKVSILCAVIGGAIGALFALVSL